MNSVKFKAKCTICKKVYAMTEQQQTKARDFGCAMSPCCMAPATIEQVKTRRAARSGS